LVSQLRFGFRRGDGGLAGAIAFDLLFGSFEMSESMVNGGRGLLVA
jgi:hypothetical protein